MTINLKTINVKVLAIIGGVILLILILLRTSCHPVSPNNSSDSTKISVRYEIRDSVRIVDSTVTHDSTIIHYTNKIHYFDIPALIDTSTHLGQLIASDSCFFNQTFIRPDTGWYKISFIAATNPCRILDMNIDASPFLFQTFDTNTVIKNFVERVKNSTSTNSSVYDSSFIQKITIGPTIPYLAFTPSIRLDVFGTSPNGNSYFHLQESLWSEKILPNDFIASLDGELLFPTSSLLNVSWIIGLSIKKNFILF